MSTNEEQLADMQKTLDQHHHELYGNGDVSNAVTYRLKRIEDMLGLIAKLGWVVISVLIAQGVSVIGAVIAWLVASGHAAT